MLGNDAPNLRPLRIRLAAATRTVGLPHYVVEKDYALGHLLAAIAAEPLLREELVFKGATCLRNVYFPDYRFSEDLDFTAHSGVGCDTLLGALTGATRRMQSTLLAFGPFEIVPAHERHRGPHPHGQCAIRVRVQFPWMRTPIDRGLHHHPWLARSLRIAPKDQLA